MKITVLKILQIIIISCAVEGVKIFSSSSKVKLRETTDPAEALKIYNKYGEYSEGFKTIEHHVCKTIDRVTNRPYGIAVCKFALQKLGKESSDDVKGSCHYLGLPSNTFKKGFQKKGKHWMNYAFKCNYGGGEIYIINGKQRYHYILEADQSGDSDLNMTIIAVFSIYVTINDYPEITVEETEDRITADNIFGFFGVAKRSGNLTHVCNKNKATKKLNGDKVCKKILIKKRKGSQLKDGGIQPTCIQLKITRKISNFVGGRLVISPTIEAIKCNYRVLGTPKRYAVFNTPTEDFYYIAEKDDTNRNHRWSVKEVIKITIKQ